MSGYNRNMGTAFAGSRIYSHRSGNGCTGLWASGNQWNCISGGRGRHCFHRSKAYSEVLENPDEISKLVLAKGLDSGTAYEIISIDIADIDIGRNIGANLQSLQAEADNKIAQARAEERRAMAVALEQEMRAAVVEAEAEIPKAMAEALRSGNIGVMDYYNLKNLQADTQMKKEIGEGITNYTKEKK